MKGPPLSPFTHRWVQARMLRRATVLFFGLLSAAVAEPENKTAVPESQPATSSQTATTPVPPSPPISPTPAPAADEAPPSDGLFDLGKSLFDQYAPAEVKEQIEFPSKEQWDAFAAKLQQALDGDSFEELAAFEPQYRSAIYAFG